MVLAVLFFLIVVWVVAVWYFGIFISESYVLIVGLIGLVMVLGGLGVVNGLEWIKVFVGLVVFIVMGFGGGYLIVKFVVKVFLVVFRRKVNKFFIVG